MSDESKTPETDAAPHYSFPNYQKMYVDIDFARKLEKERDDARAALIEAMERELTWSSVCHVGMSMNAYADMIARWRKAAGLTGGEKSG